MSVTAERKHPQRVKWHECEGVVLDRSTVVNVLGGQLGSRYKTVPSAQVCEGMESSFFQRGPYIHLICPRNVVGQSGNNSSSSVFVDKHTHTHMYTNGGVFKVCGALPQARARHVWSGHCLSAMRSSCRAQQTDLKRGWTGPGRCDHRASPAQFCQQQICTASS